MPGPWVRASSLSGLVMLLLLVAVEPAELVGVDGLGLVTGQIAEAPVRRVGL